MADSIPIAKKKLIIIMNVCDVLMTVDGLFDQGVSEFRGSR